MKNLHKIVYITLASLSLSALMQAKAQIIISEVDPSGSSANHNNYAADWFELTNTGSTAVNISGWKMDDNSDSFSSAVPLTGVSSIAAGQSVIFIEDTSASSDAALEAQFKTDWFGSVANAPAGFTIGAYGGSGVGLGTGGDQVNIFNASGTQITGIAFGTSTDGVSFDNSVSKITGDGTVSTLSTVGINGAFKSATGETGSPGIDTVVTVPEPSSYALIIGGLLALVGMQMRRRVGTSSKL